MVKNKVIFLDRDGIINEDLGYVYKISNFIFKKNIFNILKTLQKEGFKLIIITNQSGIGREYYTEDDFLKLNDFMLKEFEKRKIKIEKVYYCPHHENGTHKDYNFKCDCRKPESGMIKKAIDEFNIDINKSFLIGDKKSDILAGQKEKIKSIFLKNSNYNLEGIKPEYTINNLNEILKIIIK